MHPLLKKLAILFTLFICFCSVPAVSAQGKDKKSKNSDQDESIQEVRFNLSVLDSSGKPARDLKAEDLKVFENEQEQKISYFAKKEPLSLGLVVDNSYSLRAQMPLVSALTKWFADKLNREDEAFLIRFVSSEKISVEMDWTSDKALLSQKADQYYPEAGSTAFIDALYLSVDKMLGRMKQDSSRRYAVILISDCEDKDSYYKMTDLYKKAAGTDVQIFIIGLVKALDADLNSLRRSPRDLATRRAERIAAKTGGIALFPETDKQKRYVTSPAAEAIITELRSQYVIGYAPTDKTANDKKRTLRVEVANDAKGEKRTAVVREGFFFR
jgi:Ca-activated chloride channel homolog